MISISIHFIPSFNTKFDSWAKSIEVKIAIVNKNIEGKNTDIYLLSLILKEKPEE